MSQMRLGTVGRDIVHASKYAKAPWKWSPTVQRLVDDVERLAELRTVISTGPAVNGKFFFYAAHLVESLGLMIGPGARGVSALYDDLRYLVTIEYGNDRAGVRNGLAAKPSARDGGRHAEIAEVGAPSAIFQREVNV